MNDWNFTQLQWKQFKIYLNTQFFRFSTIFFSIYRKIQLRCPEMMSWCFPRGGYRHICAKTSQLMCLTCEQMKTSQKEHRRCTQGHMTRTAKKIKYEWVQICHYYPSQRKPITFVYDLTIQRGAKQMASRVFPAFKTEFAGGHIALQGWGGGCWRAITAKHSTAMHSFGQTLFKWDEILLICEGRQMR